MERCRMGALQSDQPLVAGLFGGHGINRVEDDTRIARDDALDRSGGEVLAVDAQPLVVAAGEVEPAVRVAGAEIARPIPTLAAALCVGFFVLVLPLETARRSPFDSSPL